MIIDKINNTDRTKLLMALDKYTSSLSKRNINFVINAPSDLVGNINIIVTGKKGTVQKNIVLVYQKPIEEWIAYSDGYEYKLLSLSEITLVLKNIVQRLSVLVTKL